MRAPVLLVWLAVTLSVHHGAAADIPNAFSYTNWIPPEQYASGTELGQAVEWYQNKAFIGSPGYYTEGGIVYVVDLTRGGSGGELTSQLPAPAQINSDDEFGTTIVRTGDRLFISAPNAWSNGLANSGIVVCYDLVTEQYVASYDAEEPQDWNDFGRAIAANDQHVFIGDPGADFHGNSSANYGVVYQFDIQSGEQVHQFQLQPFIEKASFGEAIALGDGMLAIGSPGRDEHGRDRGAVYLYDSHTREQLAILSDAGQYFQARFGGSLAFSDEYLFVGAWRAGSGDTLPGLVYVYDLSTFELVTVMESPDGTPDGWFGYTIEVWNNHVLISAPRAESLEDSVGGTVYVYDLDTLELTRRVRSATPDNEESFGMSIAVSSSGLMIGAPDMGPNRGRAYFIPIDEAIGCPTDLDGSGTTDLADLNMVLANFGAVCGTTTEQAMLVSPDPAENAYFGYRLDFNDEFIVVGSPQDSQEETYGGVVHVFDAETRALLHELRIDPDLDDRSFGLTLAVDGDIAYIASNQRVFEYDLITGEQLRVFVSEDHHQNDRFGHSLAVSGELLLVGAPEDRDNGGDSGSAYLFDRVTGDQVLKILPDDGIVSAKFGYAVDLDGDLIAISAPYDHPEDSFYGPGAVYVFSTDTGEQINKIEPAHEVLDSQFGWSIDLEGTLLAIGSPEYYTSVGYYVGAAFVADALTGNILHEIQFDHPRSHDFLGWSIAIVGDRVAVGAPARDGNELGCGAILLYDMVQSEVVAELAADHPLRNGGVGHALAARGTRLLSGDPTADPYGERIGLAYLFETGPIRNC